MFSSDVTLYNVHVQFEIDHSGIGVTVHPTWLCWTDTHDVLRGVCFGNVMVCDCTLPSEMHKCRIVAHEARHSEQWRALGEWTWFAQLVLPLEPAFVDWSDPSVELVQMWNPPDEWPDQWNYLSIRIARR